MLAFIALPQEPEAVSLNIRETDNSVTKYLLTYSDVLLSRYSVVLAEYPYAVFFVTSLVIMICGLCSFVPQFNAPEIPDFSTPVMVRSYLIQLFFIFISKKQNSLYVHKPFDSVPVLSILILKTNACGEFTLF